jgi:hypothetical protein
MQLGGEAPGAAADVEHPLRDEVTLAGEQLDELAPVLVDRPQQVVSRC